MTPELSIVMPVYIKDRALAAMTRMAVRFLRARAQAESEMIIVDDGSPFEVPDLLADRVIVCRLSGKLAKPAFHSPSRKRPECPMRPPHLNGQSA